MVSSLGTLVAASSALLFSYYCHGFSPSLVGVSHHSPPQQSSCSFLTTRTCCSMVTTERSSQPRRSSDNDNDNNERMQPLPLPLNTRLDQLAQRCADPKEHVILLASKCEDLFQQATAAKEADAVSFNIHLKAWKNTCATLAEHRQNAYASGRKQVQQQQQQQPEEIPSVPVYTARDAVERATNILLETERMLQEHPNSTIVPDCVSYNAVIDAWAKSRVDDAPQACERLLKRMLDHPTLEPDTISYNGVLDAWAHSKSHEGMDRVLKIWRHMEQLYEHGNTRVKPTMRTIHSILSAYAKRVRELSGAEALEAARAAHSVLLDTVTRFEQTNDADYQVDVMAYTSVMDAYAQCGSLEATQCAEELLTELKEYYKNTGNTKLQPNYRTYTSLITAWAKTKSTKSPHRAEELLQEMYEGGGGGGDSSITKPNARSYTGVLQAWARSRDPTKPQRVLRLLKQMKELSKNGNKHVHPNLLAYNAAIDACARCQGDTKQQMEALKIAFAILKSIQMEPDIEPNHVTYGTILKATAFLLPAGEERNKVASALFEKARTAAMIDVNMIKNMRKAVDSNVMRELFVDMADSKGHLDYNHIPPAWSRNVRY